MINRRAALGLAAGTGAALVLARAFDQGLIYDFGSPGLAAWRDWDARRYDGPLALVSAGILASSPHNTQPWRFAVNRLGVDIFEMPARTLGSMDPFGRERRAGLGAAIHNMALAASSIGRSAVVRLLPDSGNPDHAARVELGPDNSGGAPHPLLPAIVRRHTHRGPWTGAPISDADLAALADFPRDSAISLQIFAAASPRGQRFAALTGDATAAIAADAAMMADSHRWFRHSRCDQDNDRDGLALRTSGVSPLLAFAGAMLPDQSPAAEGKYWLAATRDVALPTASTYALISAADIHDRRTALLVGAAWQRLHLIATARGLAAQPLNQLPEIIDRARQQGRPSAFARDARALIDDSGRSISFALRLGRADSPAPASLRRPVSDVIGAPARLGYDIERARAATRAQELALERLRATNNPP